MPSLGAPEILVILVVALLVLGPTKLPEAGRQLGRALAEFRRWSDGVQTELRDALSLDTQEGPPVMEGPPSPAESQPPMDQPEPAQSSPSPPAQGTEGVGEPNQVHRPSGLAPQIRSPQEFPEAQSFS